MSQYLTFDSPNYSNYPHLTEAAPPRMLFPSCEPPTSEAHGRRHWAGTDEVSDSLALENGNDLQKSNVNGQNGGPHLGIAIVINYSYS